MLHPSEKHSRQENLDGSADTVSEVSVLERKNAERLPALGLAREELLSRYNITNLPSQSDTDVLSHQKGSSS